MSKIDKDLKFDINDISEPSQSNAGDEYVQQLELQLQDYNKIRTEINELKDQNQHLTEQNSILQGKIEWITQDYETKIKTIQSVTSNQLESKNNMITKLNSEIKSIEDTFTEKLKQSNLQNNEIKRSLDQKENSITKFQDKMQNNQFNSLDEISNFIETKFNEMQNEMNKMSKREQSVPISDFKKLSNEYQQTKSKLSSTISDLNAQLAAANDKISEFDAQLDEIQKKSLADELNYTKEITSVKNERDKLKLELDSLTEKLKANQADLDAATIEQTKKDSEISKLSAQNTENDNIIQKAKTKISKLQAALSDLKQENDTKEQQISEMAEDIEIRQTIIDSLTSEKETLSNYIDELNEKVQQKEEQNSNLNNAIAEKQQKNEALEKELQASKNSISNLAKEKSNLTNTINDLKSKLDQKAKDAQGLSSQIKSLQNDLVQLKNENQNQIAKIKLEHAAISDDMNKKMHVPLSAFEIIGAPRDLIAKLHEIGSNQTMQIPAKVTASLTSLYDYMKRQKNDQSESQISLLNEKVGGYSNLINLLSQIKPDDKNISQEDLASDETAQKQFVQSIKTALDEFPKLHAEKQKIEQAMSDIMKAANAKKPADIVTALNDANKSVQDLSNFIEKLHEKNKKLKSDIGELHSANSELNDQISKKSEQIDELKNNVNDMVDEIHKKNIEIEKLNGEIENQKNNFEIKFKNSIEKVNNDNLEKAKKLLQEIENLKAEGQERENLLKQVSDKLEKYKLDRKRLKTMIRDRDNQLADVQNKVEQEFDAKSQAEREGAMAQLNDLKKVYEGVLQELKKKNTDLLAENENLQNSIKKVSQKLEENQSTSQSLEDKLVYAGNAFEQLKKKYIELKKNSEMREKTQKMLITNETNNKLQNMKARYEIESRKIYSDIVMQLMMFYDTNELPSYDVVMKVVSKAKEAINRLTAESKAIRGMLGITENESLENAIHNILSKYNF
ncbi:hypothetical protein TVAG_168900 [Trichomonas vaginalis G3]|uniref:t-SNARE coiled-coil homology domain-containing protein n=1 Tax=Trichomonas vaginalis (strain ATCC PRA-98 / G3) TaxID=412133 RepID=A2EWQ8_TRIV3|nr:biological adhesion protein [Trichomonas vaginalis G3]EAY02888.1 hypothetical protein TVAG_168900 [Trichomonas vaginalis G3]KAI5551253.1 biological adhesion protein [Trichomonas vaginalis G3]|eukprot:XP_001315111.1 hypothetical protein [Trichomonas vaginalis G3]